MLVAEHQEVKWGVGEGVGPGRTISVAEATGSSGSKILAGARLTWRLVITVRWSPTRSVSVSRSGGGGWGFGSLPSSKVVLILLGWGPQCDAH